MKTSLIVTFVFFVAIVLNYQKELTIGSISHNTNFINEKIDKIVDTLIKPDVIFEHQIENLEKISDVYLVKQPDKMNKYDLINHEGVLYFRYKPHETFSGTDTAIIHTELVDNVLSLNLSSKKELILLRVNEPGVVAQLNNKNYNYNYPVNNIPGLP